MQEKRQVSLAYDDGRRGPGQQPGLLYFLPSSRSMSRQKSIKGVGEEAHCSLTIAGKANEQKRWCFMPA